MDSKTILLVEDETLHRMTLIETLTDAGYQVLSAEDGQQALNLMTKHHFGVALLDIKLPDISGIELFHELQRRQPDCNTLLMTGQSSVEAAVAAMRDGAYDYLAKPFKMDLLLMRLERAFQLQQLRQQVSEATQSPIIESHSPKFQQVIQASQVAAKTQATVLILGESGVGKERLADYIHQNSPRAKGPMIRVNCAAIPETLLEGELFGYTKGAFSGASHAHDGLLLQADGGTLFLDEVGEIPLPVQVKLLRVLQERTLRRLGEQKDRNVDFRLIAATHQAPSKLVQQGKMREDFFYRLNVIPLQIPALRERQDDLHMLIVDIIREISTQYDQVPIVLSSDSLSALEHYRYPGNIRELRNILERLQVLYAGKTIEPGQLPAEVLTGPAAGVDLIQAVRTDRPLKVAVREFEERFIQTVVHEEGGNRTAAAKRLGISRKTLWEKFRETEEDS